MKFLARLTIFDFALVIAFVIVGAIWAGQRSAPAPEAAFQPAVTATAPTAAEATDAAVDAIVAADGPAFVAALLDVANAAGDTGNIEAMAAVAAFADAFAGGDDRTYENAALRLEEMADDPVVGPLVRRMSTAFVSAVMDFPVGPAAQGTEWAQILVLPTGDTPIIGPLPGSVTWSVTPDGAMVAGAITIPDGPLTGTVTIAAASAPGTDIDIVAAFGGPLALAPIARIDSVSHGDGRLAYDEPFDADLRIDGPWQVTAGLSSASSGNIFALREAETLAWSGVLADGGRFVIRVVMGDTGRRAIEDLDRTGRL